MKAIPMPEDLFPAIDRRAAILGSVAAAVAISTPVGAASPRRFPKGFRWGASTAAHQVEGNNVNSDLWIMENLPNSTFKDRSADACDSYHRWREDIALLKAIGLNCYRMSVEWARIEPSPGHFSEAELDHYRQVLSDLRNAGIEPMITYYHVSAPRWFAEMGGWLNPDAPALFARFCERTTRALGDSIAFACTINEPQVSLTLRVMAPAYFAADDARQLAAHAAAARKTGSDRFVTMNHPDVEAMTPLMMQAHEQGYAAIKSVLPNVPTGVTLALIDFAKANEGSEVDELRRLAYGGWLDTVKRCGDFVGVQTYEQFRIPGAGAPLPPLPALPFPEPADPRDQTKQPVALRNTVEYAFRETGKPVFVTENGCQTDNDARRAWYIPRALDELHQAMENGVPVMGYMHWSLIDNFEWAQGYAVKFGLASVDSKTFKRTLKPSAGVYRRIVKANALAG